MRIRLVAISDTHGLHRQLDVPEGDILIHAGDITEAGTPEELDDFNAFLGGLPHPHKIVIAGNHDFCFQHDRTASAARLPQAIYLQDEAIRLYGIRFYGSPWQPWFYDWAFNLPRGPAIRRRWELIPADTDVLITHGPPFGYGDRTDRGFSVGCQDLLDVVEKIRPRVHIFGHIHEGAGVRRNEHTTFINASSCNLNYEVVHSPVVYDYEI